MMPNQTTTGTAVRLLDSDDYPWLTSEQTNMQNRLLERAAELAFEDLKSNEIRIDPSYFPNIPAATPWLSAVERRIENSILPEEYKGYHNSNTTEWISEEVGNSALRFFQNAADLLPVEPHIYSSLNGALVAEFETPKGRLTAIISPAASILFATRVDMPGEPIEITVRRGSNRLREDLREIALALSRPHGQVESNR